MRIFLFMLGLLFWIPSSASATYSIVAADPSTATLGGAGASCVGELDVRIIHRIVPGKGVVHAQARINTEGRDEAERLLGMDLAPDAILDQVTAGGFDTDAAERQYAIVDLAGRRAAFTGAENGNVADDRGGEDDALHYVLAGNILTSEAVLQQAELGFRAAGCDLPERLLLALEAGAENGQGDSRCTASGIPADSAFLRVVAGDGATLIDLSVTDTAPQSPLVLLRQQFDVWRQANPCPSTAIDAGPSRGSNEPASKGCSASGTSNAMGLGLALALLLCRRRFR